MPRPKKAEGEVLVPVPLRMKQQGKDRLDEIARASGTDRSAAARMLFALGDAAYRRGERPRAGDLR